MISYRSSLTRILVNGVTPINNLNCCVEEILYYMYQIYVLHCKYADTSENLQCKLNLHQVLLSISWSSVDMVFLEKQIILESPTEPFCLTLNIQYFALWDIFKQKNHLCTHEYILTMMFLMDVFFFNNEYKFHFLFTYQ